MKIVRHFTIACIIGIASGSAAYADDCSGRDHTAGTVMGAAGGALIGGAASHNAGGAVAGAVVGGLAGNAIARAQDCNRNGEYQRGGYEQRGGYDRGAQGYAYYGPSYAAAPDENDYWGVESYADFTADYRHIQYSIDRAQERGSLRPWEARRFSQELQQIRYQAERQEQRGRFDPQETEDRLGQLRQEMREARHENRDEGRSGYR